MQLKRIKTTHIYTTKTPEKQLCAEVGSLLGLANESFSQTFQDQQYFLVRYEKFCWLNKFLQQIKSLERKRTYKFTAIWFYSAMFLVSFYATVVIILVNVSSHFILKLFFVLVFFEFLLSISSRNARFIAFLTRQILPLRIINRTHLYLYLMFSGTRVKWKRKP